jgi:putative phage-type endonuclease
MQQVNLKQRSPEWYEFRRNHIGGSDAAVCLGESPYMSAHELYLEKLGLGKPKQVNSYMQQGIDLEEPARSAFENIMGISVFPVCRKSRHTDFMMASLDGLDMDEKIAVEIKCPSNMTYHQMALDGQVPDHHMPQLQHQLSVLGLDVVYFFSYTLSSHAIVEVKRDEKYIKNLIEKEKAFWDYVLKKEPPPLTEKDYVFCESPEWKELTDEWRTLSDLEDRKEVIRNRLIAIAGEKNAKGNGCTLTKVHRKGNVVYSKIEYLKTIDLEPYRSPPVESWRLSMNG